MEVNPLAPVDSHIQHPKPQGFETILRGIFWTCSRFPIAILYNIHVGKYTALIIRDSMLCTHLLLQSVECTRPYCQTIFVIYTPLLNVYAPNNSSHTSYSFVTAIFTYFSYISLCVHSMDSVLCPWKTLLIVFRSFHTVVKPLVHFRNLKYI